MFKDDPKRYPFVSNICGVLEYFAIKHITLLTSLSENVARWMNTDIQTLKIFLDRDCRYCLPSIDILT